MPQPDSPPARGLALAEVKEDVVHRLDDLLGPAAPAQYMLTSVAVSSVVVFCGMLVMTCPPRSLPRASRPRTSRSVRRGRRADRSTLGAPDRRPLGSRGCGVGGRGTVSAVVRVRHHALDRLEVRPLERPNTGGGAAAPACRAADRRKGLHRRPLSHLAEVHDHDLVAGLGHNAQVVGMSMTAIPRSFCSAASRSRIRAWVVTSSAVVGSSAINGLGLHDSAHGDHGGADASSSSWKGRH